MCRIEKQEVKACYFSHFGHLKNLSQGDEITFTDVDGNMFGYEVIELETLSNELSLMRRDGLIRYEKNHFDVMEQIETQHL